MTVELHHGDCLDIMPTLQENSIDTIITDPPYGLEFMGKEWDHGVPGVPFWQAALRVAKPGAVLLAFGGTRTHHRLMCAIEDAGWEIRDCLMYLYGSGFPKSLSISKQLDKQEQNKWLKISKAIDNLDICAIIEIWKKYSSNVKSAGLQFAKNQIEAGTNTQKKDFALASVLLSVNPEKPNAPVIIAELSLSAAHHTLGGFTFFAQENAEATTGQLNESVNFAGQLSGVQKATSPTGEAGSHTAAFTVLCDAREFLGEKTVAKIKAAEALKTWLGSKKSSRAQDTNALCAALINDLKHTILSKSETFQSLDTIQQMDFVSATSVIITESTAALLITFTADTLKKYVTDKVAGAEREVVGRYIHPDGKRRPNSNRTTGTTYGEHKGPLETIYTTPATDAAKLWHGYGTALKPAFEPILLCRKPLTLVPFYDILVETQTMIGGLLCLLLSNANNAEGISRLSPPVRGEVSVSALMLAAVLRGASSLERSEMMGIFNSQETASTCLSIATLWSSILGDILEPANTYTTSMVNEVITGLKTLNYLLSTSIPVEAIRAVSLPVGSMSGAGVAENDSKSDDLSTKKLQAIFAADLVTLHTKRNGTLARNAAGNLQQIIPSVVTVLNRVQHGLTTESGEGLRPNWEPIILAMKPRDGTFANNALEWGCGGLWIDGARIAADDPEYAENCSGDRGHSDNRKRGSDFAMGCGHAHNQGRWPANLILDEAAAAMLDEQSGESSSTRTQQNDNRYNAERYADLATGYWGARAPENSYTDAGGASRFFYTAKASRSERNAGLDNFYWKRNGKTPQRITRDEWEQLPERERMQGNIHPTVKPISLLRYLCRLTKMPAGGTVLDMFMGSGSTGVACLPEGLDFIGIEKDRGSFDIAQARIEHAQNEIVQMALQI